MVRPGDPAALFVDVTVNCEQGLALLGVVDVQSGGHSPGWMRVMACSVEKAVMFAQAYHPGVEGRKKNVGKSMANAGAG